MKMKEFLDSGEGACVTGAALDPPMLVAVWKEVIQQPVQNEAVACTGLRFGGTEVSVSLGLLSKLYHLKATHQMFKIYLQEA